jgi:hypothetical protein
MTTPEKKPDDPIAFIAVPTPPLRALVSAQKSILPAQEFADLLANIRSIFEKFSEKLRAFPRGTARARALHRMIDSELAAASSVEVSCRRGCCGCCHYEVEVTADEAELLAEAVREGTEVERARLVSQAGRERKSPEWQRFFSPDNRCVFLGQDGACRVYDRRPSSCRKLLVTTPASACTELGARIAPVRVLLADLALSAALSLEGSSTGSLPSMLLRALDS